MSDNLVQRLRKFVPPRGLRVDESEFAMADAADEIERLSAANAELLKALIDVWRKNSAAAMNGYRDHSLLEALFLTNQATSAAIKNAVSEERHQELREEISNATEGHVD